MAKYLIGVDFQPGIVDTPMSVWTAEEVKAHLDYYRALNDELVARGELVDATILTGPDLAKIVRSDGGAPVVEVDSEERAIEIAAKVSAVPGPGGVPFGQPIHVRRVMDETPSNPDEMDDFLRTAVGVR